MHAIAEAVLIAMHRRGLADAEMESLATLVGIADRFHVAIPTSTPLPARSIAIEFHVGFL